MRGVGIGFLLVLAISLPAVNQQPAPSSSQDEGVMLAAVSRDSSMLGGGLGSGLWTGRGTVVVEPLAHITPVGEWIGISCGSDHPATCKEFERQQPDRARRFKLPGSGWVIAMNSLEPVPIP